MDRKRYPKNWDAIALTVKLAANSTCQECGKPCRRPGESCFDFFERVGWEYAEESRWGRYVLTVAHLDQNPANNDPDNMKALCSVCHLRHDAPFRKANSLAKRERQGQLRLEVDA
jgi:5-methylcytosine-specific restriction endonuclease McrA